MVGRTVSLYALLGLLIQIKHISSVSQRKIYTLFTRPKTWNEAHAICDDQLGTLVKIRSDREIEELKYLDTVEWGNTVSTILSGTGFWGGLHRPFSSSNDSWEYQDCEAMSTSLSFINPGPISADQHCGVFKDSTYDLYEDNCTYEKPFICQRFTGDCWYEPHLETVPGSVGPTDLHDDFIAEEASDCAMECRTMMSPECWSFIWDPTQVGGDRCLRITNSDITASSYYVKAANRITGLPDQIFYVRVCFEGVKDTNSYGSFSDNSITPDSFCSSHIYEGEPQAPEVCFCSTVEHPPIPPPLSSEAMAEQYASELTMDTGNTSAAQRKLSSAEDNRPSAVGVGFLGVGLLTAVFGGLFLMDLPVLYSALKDILCSSTEAVTVAESDC